MRVCVVIPTYNEARSIGDIIARLRRKNLEALVVDDGSRDETPLIAEKSGAAVIRNPGNQGKGTSLIRGFEYAIRNNFEAVVTMDGDGQHLPEDISVFLDAAQDDAVSLIIGNRMGDSKGMPAVRWLTNKFMSWLISKVIGQRVADTQCGFRLIKTDALRKIHLRTSNFETESEVIIRFARAGYRIKSVPVKTVYRNEKSRINPFIDTLRFIRFIFGKINK
jgi:glycosyltransferase involved in cell wall biosynthesis